MKALVLHGKNGDYKYEPNWKMPEVQPGWAIVKVAYSGICGSDLPRYASAGSYHHPVILGHEFSGYVHETTSDSNFKTGDRVAVLPIIPCEKCYWCKKGEAFHCDWYQFIGSRNDGGHAEYCAVPESNLFLLPDNIDIAEGSLVEPLLVALNTVRRSGFTPGKSAIVFGAGPIGMLVACWLRVFGATRVVVSDLRQFSLDIAKDCGFDDIYNPFSDSPDGFKDFDYAFEAAGSGKALQTAVDMLKIKGVLTIVGRDVNDTVIPVKTFETLMRKEVTLNGCWGYHIDGEKDFLYQTMKNNLIPSKKLITHKVTIEESAEMIDRIIEKKLDYCKVVLDFTN